MRFLKNYVRLIPWLMVGFSLVFILAIIIAVRPPFWLSLLMLVVGLGFAWGLSYVMVKFLFNNISAVFIPQQISGESVLHEPITIKFSLIEDDIQRYYRQIFSGRKIINLISILIGLSFLVSAFLNHNFILEIIWLFWFVWMASYLFYYGSRLQLNRLLKQPWWTGQIGTHELTIRPDGVLDSGSFGERQDDWNTVALFKPTNDYFVLRPRKPYLKSVPYIIPRAAFENNSGFEEFVEASKNFQNSALSK